MGDVAIIVKVMPESPDVDLEELKAAIKEKYPGTQDMQAEPIGFGLSALKVAIVIPDGEAGASEEAEQILASIKGVQSAEIVSLTLT
ncbi:elongation factor 1-beta [Methanomicrobium antiquum]|uniref:Elongation factor 1-beta n=1 Tax=Methanomicrobium antiquum TaxID=487686 RepID=A0AAF0FL25_9EURY|nr:elongation factor 1-beta [Methanomicrobium antiquum]MDD3977608.1 elongation factor 1-beta [Methanomicrobium sp.]WFN36498.1 elongation factor 1-beta [Methanomicrobium antiquum]